VLRTDFYDIKEPIGKGTCGEVRRAVHRETGRQWAVKIVEIKRFSLQPDFDPAELLQESQVGAPPHCHRDRLNPRNQTLPQLFSDCLHVVCVFHISTNNVMVILSFFGCSQVLSALEHEGVINFKEIFQTEAAIYIVMVCTCYLQIDSHCRFGDRN